MKHFKDPLNNQKLQNPDIEVDDIIPSCGDHIVVQAIVCNQELEKISFWGSGCIISQATASMVSEKIIGKKLKDILSLDKDFIYSILNFELGPNRLKCALFGLESLQKGIKKYQESVACSNVKSSKSSAKIKCNS